MELGADQFALARRCHERGELAEAERLYREILQAEPRFAPAWHLLGVIASQCGRHDAAVNLFGRANALNPADAEAHNNLGSALLALGALDKGTDCFRRAVELHPTFVEALYNWGNALAQQGKLTEAINAYQRAIEHNRGVPEIHRALGRALTAENRFEDAAYAYRNLASLRPSDAESQFELALALQTCDRLEEAVTVYRQALAIEPRMAGAQRNLGAALKSLNRLQEAEACFRRAVELNGADAEAHFNLGSGLAIQGKFEEAAAAYEQAVQLDPNHAEAQWNLGTLRMLHADFQRGWAGYEWRSKTRQLPVKEYGAPRWNGEPLEAKTVLVHAEQGLGDTIQFVRYLKAVKERVANVVFACPKPLVKLLSMGAGSAVQRRTIGVDQFVAEGDALPKFDFQVPLLSLPLVFGTRLETIPAEVPYVFSDEKLVGQWHEKLNEVRGFRVGVNWQGRQGIAFAERRDIPIEMFERLAGMPGVRLVSLQKETESKAESRRSKVEGEAKPAIVELGKIDTEHGAFMDTAAIMMNLDLVITSDTSVAHLAGALGVPVWLALPFVPDWRWLLDRSDSPWYPTMRLFRQKQLGNWEGVFEEIEAALSERVA
jgi:tetratricopeptide (TPR) repeat protein